MAFAALGSGALRHVHELAHAAEDARRPATHGHHDGDGHEHEGDAPHAHAHVPARGSPDDGHRRHDHSPLGDAADCLVHAQLNLPMLQGGHAPLLACLGLFVAFLTCLPAPAIRSRRPLLRLDSRGPPTR